jgi:hypothetical protein
LLCRTRITVQALDQAAAGGRFALARVRAKSSRSPPKPLELDFGWKRTAALAWFYSPAQ